MYGLARGTSMLVGAVIAGFLLWLATQFEAATAPSYWAFVGLIAAAGLVLALAQIAGGWTKWGAPRITGAAFLLGFLPALVIGGWVLLAAQPEGAWMQATAESWANQLALGGVLETMIAVLPAIAFALGLLFGYTLDTTGARVVAAEPAPANDAARPIDDEEARAAEERRAAREEERVHARDERVRDEDEPVRAERESDYVREDERVEDEYREPDRDVVSAISGGGGDGRAERHEDRQRGEEPRRRGRFFGRR